MKAGRSPELKGLMLSLICSPFPYWRRRLGEPEASLHYCELPATNGGRGCDGRIVEGTRSDDYNGDKRFEQADESV